MQKVIELVRLRNGWDYAERVNALNCRFMLCTGELGNYFELPKPLPAKIWLQLSTTKTENSYLVEVIDYSYLSITTKTGKEMQYVHYALASEVKKFPRGKCYLSIMYEED